jgi:hypothetical protein
VEKYGGEGKATDDNMAHAPKATNKRTHVVCNTHCFSTAALVARMRINVTIYVHRVSCYFYASYNIIRIIVLRMIFEIGRYRACQLHRKLWLEKLAENIILDGKIVVAHTLNGSAVWCQLDSSGAGE